MRTALLVVLLALAGCAYAMTPTDFHYTRDGATDEDLAADRRSCELEVYAAWRAGLVASGTVLLSEPPSPEALALSLPQAMRPCMEAKGYEAFPL